MAQVRQSLAITVLLLGTPCLLERKYLKYSLCVGLACLFHVSAIFAFICIPLSLKFPKWLQLIFALFGFVLIRFPQLPIKFLLLLASFISGIYHDMIVNYLTSSRFGKNIELGSGLYFYAKQLLMLFIVLFHKTESDNDNLFLNSLIFSCIINDAALAFQMFGRLESYVGFYAIIGWTFLFDMRLLRSDKNLFFAVFMLFILFFSIPFCKARTKNGIDPLSKRRYQYQWLPYYNVFFHPEEAQYRKDWNQ